MKTYKYRLLLFFSYLFCSPFLAAQVKPYDILINEFMADPAPPVGLPNVEFIELFNRRKDTIIDLKDFKIVVSGLLTIIKFSNSISFFDRLYNSIYSVFGSIPFLIGAGINSFIKISYGFTCADKNGLQKR